MEKEFVQYTEALELKEIGFDEPCLACYIDEEDKDILSFSFDSFYCHQPIEDNELKRNTQFKNSITAPTFSQAFRWFRKKYDLHPYIITLKGEWIVIGIIRCSDAEKITGSFDTSFNTLEEAELASLKKLIEIVKEK